MLLVYVALNYFYNSPNASPGPFWPHLTGMLRYVDLKGRRPELTPIALHQKYGEIVRLGPCTLSLAGPKVTKVIHILNNGFFEIVIFRAHKNLHILIERSV
jgi:hypothetical protein